MNSNDFYLFKNMKNMVQAEFREIDLNEIFISNKYTGK